MLCDHSIFQVLVSTQGRNDYNFFTDTLYAVMSDTSSWRTYTASLDAYRGQNIYIAFHSDGWYYSPDNYSNGGVVRIDTVQILSNDTVWYTVTVTSADENMGTVTGGGTYESHTPAILTASPLEGYLFDHWDDGDTSNPRWVLVVSDTSFTAFFRWAEDSLGIDNDWASALNFQLSIYPNPAHNDVTISVSEPSFITVFDMTGKVVIPQTSIDSEHIIPLSTLASGLYLVRCQTAYGIAIKKLIIK